MRMLRQGSQPARTRILAALATTVKAAVVAAEETSRGCISCHKNVEPMHASAVVRLSCVDCHGGNASATTKEAAHVTPGHPEIWKSSANPPRTYTALLQ